MNFLSKDRLKVIYEIASFFKNNLHRSFHFLCFYSRTTPLLTVLTVMSSPLDNVCVKNLYHLLAIHQSWRFLNHNKK